ncbi:RnaseH-domain-containing protein [Suillus ampliporus]|nr:RnaseH-domain-containing protein [Suillus ampliporus]
MHMLCMRGIWVGDNHQLNKAIKIGELTAVLVALQLAEPQTPLKIVTDSKYVIEGLTTHLTNWEDTGWIGIANVTLFKSAAYHLRRRPTPTTFQWVKGHNGHVGNEKADQLMLAGALRTEPDQIDTYIPRNFDTQGAKLTKISQKLAYREIMNKTNLTYKRATLALLDITRSAVETISSNLETDETIWRSCRNKDISKSIQMFLYKSLNNAYRIGEYWESIPNYTHRAFCNQCPGEIESMEHILTQCSSPINKTIWQLAKDTWPEPHIGLVLGCGTISLPNTSQNATPNDRNNTQILRGASLIRESTHNEDTVRRRWANAIDKRLQLDRALTSKTRRDTKTITKVETTWSDVLHNQQQTPHDDWVTNLEVLVGIKLPRPPQNEATR